MSISICFLHEVQDESDIAIGQITLGTFVEELEIDLTVWNRERYEQQWKDGIQRLLGGALKSCLITSFWSDRKAFGGEWWTIYRVEDQVVIQNQLIRPDIFDQDFGSFDPDNPYPSIPERRSVGEDGQRISEWFVPFAQVAPSSPLK